MVEMRAKYFAPKKTFRKNIIREIKGSFSRFMAILAIVALGVGFLAGLMATTPDMELSADKYYDDTNTMDIHVMSTLGLTENDVDAIKEIDSISDVMPAYSADIILNGADNDSIVSKIHSIPINNQNYQNQVVIKEGRMPQNPGECVIEHKSMMNAPIVIGDILEISGENINPEDKLSANEFEVVGIVQSAQYFSSERERSTVGNGTVGLIMYTPEESFSYEIYTDIYATVKNAPNLNTFTDEYDDLIEKSVTEIEDVSTKQIALRHDEILNEAYAELQDARDEYNTKKSDAEKELQDALDKLENGEKEIKDAEAEISDGYKKLADGRAELDKQKLNFNTQIAENRQQIDDGKKQLADAKAELEAVKKTLDETSEQIEEIRPLAPSNPQIAEEVEKYDQGVIQYNMAAEELNSKETELLSSEKLLNDTIIEAENKFSSTQKTLENSENDLGKAQNDLAAAKIDLEDGTKKYNESKAEADKKLYDAEKELTDAEYEISKLEYPEWYVLDRHSNRSYVSFLSNSQKVEAIAKVFPIFFFLVAALVALTTMTRMVEEERTQIGTFKALGYSKVKIASKYIIYASLASILGSAIGLLVGFKLFPTVIWNAYEMLYTLPPLITKFHLNYALASSLTAIFCTLAATIAACYGSLAEYPARLMLPRAPKAGKRVFLEYVTPIWKRLKFTHKVTARNLIRYKKRFFMTVIGIAGCTALLLTGFGLRDSIGDVMHKQFSEIFKYNLIVNVKNEKSLAKSSELQSIFSNENEISSFTPIHQENVTASSNNSKSKVEVMITSIEDESKLKDFITLQDRKTKKDIEFNENTVVVTEKLAESLGLNIGDKITLEISDNKRADFTISGITENYVTGYVYIPDSIYREAYGKNPLFNMLIANVPNVDLELRDKMSTELLKIDEVNAVTFTDVMKDEFDDLLSKIDYIIIVLIVSAGLLAFIVLYNLTNINITERQKEIATIKVLGFYDKEVGAYVYRETVILSIIGTLAGLILGIFLHAFVVKTAEVDAVMFGRTIYPLSFIFSFLLTMLFSLSVNLVMNKKLRKIDMVESMKANE